MDPADKFSLGGPELVLAGPPMDVEHTGVEVMQGEADEEDRMDLQRLEEVVVVLAAGQRLLRHPVFVGEDRRPPLADVALRVGGVVEDVLARPVVVVVGLRGRVHPHGNAGAFSGGDVGAREQGAVGAESIGELLERHRPKLWLDRRAVEKIEEGSFVEAHRRFPAAPRLARSEPMQLQDLRRGRWSASGVRPSAA